MLRWLAIVALAACGSPDDAEAKIVSASVVVEGGTSFMVAVDATLVGPEYQDGGLVWTSQETDALFDTSNFDTLALSAGDQIYHPGAAIHFVDTRTEAPAAVVARCGKQVGIDVVVGVVGSGSTQATSTVTIDCH
jgi:hypothetical protein